jgi:hypothetical protein
MHAPQFGMAVLRLRPALNVAHQIDPFCTL